MALIAAIIGLPMFFEIGVVILVPIIILVGRRTGVSLMKIGIPALAGLSVLHGLVPPHPGPVTAIELLNANLGYTLIFGLIVAVPTLIIAGPLLAQLMDRLVPVYAEGSAAGGGAVAETAEESRNLTDPDGDDATPDTGSGPDEPTTRRPPFAAAVLTMVLPVVLMLGKAIADLTAKEVAEFGTPSTS